MLYPFWFFFVEFNLYWLCPFLMPVLIFLLTLFATCSLWSEGSRNTETPRRHESQPLPPWVETPSCAASPIQTPVDKILDQALNLHSYNQKDYPPKVLPRTQRNQVCTFLVLECVTWHCYILSLPFKNRNWCDWKPSLELRQLRRRILFFDPALDALGKPHGGLLALLAKDQHLPDHWTNIKSYTGNKLTIIIKTRSLGSFIEDGT